MINESAAITGVIRNGNNDANSPLLIEACFVVNGTDLSFFYEFIVSSLI